jgi:osmotically-inducible protein OsmY
MTTATLQQIDERIQRDVLDELTWDARVRSTEVGVAVKDGVVTLTGWLDSYAKKWAAERVAHSVHGVQAVANDIEVRLPSSAERTDPDIATAAIRALQWDAYIQTERLDVTVARGWLTLKGDVEWEFQRRSAERAVRRLSGIRGVTNLISVRPRLQPTPEDLRHRIENALIRNAETDARRVRIDVDGNRVTLRGAVGSWAEQRAAERTAWSAPGVASVDNRITIHPSD